MAPIFLGVSHLEALLIGTAIAAVSPAVIVPKMLDLTEKGYGTKKAIPQMILASASVDDVFVIVLFTVCSSLVKTGTADFYSLLRIPSSIILGLLFGAIIGVVFNLFFKKFHFRDSIKVLVILSISFIWVGAEGFFSGILGFSGRLAVMSLGGTLKLRKPILSKSLSLKFL